MTTGSRRMERGEGEGINCSKHKANKNGHTHEASGTAE
jgi:hypothetical protein